MPVSYDHRLTRLCLQPLVLLRDYNRRRCNTVTVRAVY